MVRALSTKKSLVQFPPSLFQALPTTKNRFVPFANIEAEKAAKFSGRTTEAALRKGVNLGDVMRLASEANGGKGGGHNIAAGAQVPLDKIDAFLKLADELVGRQLKGEKLASKSDA